MLTMKHTSLALSRILLVALVLMTTQIASAVENESAVQENDTVLEPIPKNARFDLKGVDEEVYAIVGRLSIRRQFLGKRVTPAYRDAVQFHCFNGTELKLSVLTNSKLEKRLLKRLANGHSLAVVATVEFERIQVGHDGINSRDRLIPRIGATDLATVESICAAAEAAGYKTADCEQFKSSLKPDYQKDDIAVSLGNVFPRLKGNPRVATVGVSGIKIFNSSSKTAKIEIVSLSVEQEDETQECALNPRSQASKSWHVEAGDWADGAYETGAMPKTVWIFDGSKPIDPKAKLKVHFKFKLNDSDPVTITRTVTPPAPFVH